MSDQGLHLESGLWLDRPDWADAVDARRRDGRLDDAQAAAKGLEPRLFTPRRGQALLWHASLRHGGSPVRDPERTRKSFVVHFSTGDSYGNRAITVAEPQPDGSDRYEVWETDEVLERDGARGFQNPLLGRHR